MSFLGYDPFEAFFDGLKTLIVLLLFFGFAAGLLAGYFVFSPKATVEHVKEASP